MTRDSDIIKVLARVLDKYVLIFNCLVYLTTLSLVERNKIQNSIIKWINHSINSQKRKDNCVTNMVLLIAGVILIVSIYSTDQLTHICSSAIR